MKDSEDFGDEFGWNVNGAISVPITGMNGRPKQITLGDFWANIEDDDSSACTVTAANNCLIFNVIDNPNAADFIFAGANQQHIGDSDRDVDHWGLSLESKRLISGGETYKDAVAPNARYVALGVDVRGIYQDFNLNITNPVNPAFLFSYNEELDTTYYGAYAAWGGDYQPFLFRNFWERHGLQSSFKLRGGVYYADTDYSGRSFSTIAPVFTNSLSLSSDDVAFIGGLVLETRKKIGARTTISLKSEYEYYSWVPEMLYNSTDINGGVVNVAGPNVGTSIGDDDAFSARTSLRLTVKLGPDSIMEPQ